MGAIFADIGDDSVDGSPRTSNYGPRFQDIARELQQLPTRSRPRIGGGSVLDQGSISPFASRSGFANVTHEQTSRQGVAREKGDILPFGRAMKDSFRKLEAATQIYSNFQFEYEDDTASIKKYATKEIIDKLWTLKVRER
jgi:hypothetical protein